MNRPTQQVQKRPNNFSAQYPQQNQQRNFKIDTQENDEQHIELNSDDTLQEYIENAYYDNNDLAPQEEQQAPFADVHFLE